MNGSVDVSVIIPCYNTQRYLDQALTSAEQNNACILEIIAINDGSSDESLALMRAHARRDRRVRVIDKTNEGYGATVNRGIREARGTYVAILEPDDYVLPQTYDALYAFAQSMHYPDVAKAGYWRVMTDETHPVRPSYGYLRGRVRSKKRCFTLAEEPELIQYHPSVWAALYKTAFLKEEGIYFKEVPGAGWVDNPFTVEALVAAATIAYTDEAYYCYREDLGTASSAHVNSRLMIDRWNDRQDVLERRAVRNREILKANAIVALRFLGKILEAQPWDTQTTEDVIAMAKRLDPSFFKEIDCISPHVLASVLELMEVDAPLPAKSTYYSHLAREAWWALCHNGVGFLTHNLMVARDQ